MSKEISITMADVLPPVKTEGLPGLAECLQNGMSMARKYYQSSLVAQCYMVAYQVLCGYELLAVRAQMPETRGRKKSSSLDLFSQDVKEPNLDAKETPFERLMGAFGVSRSTGYVFMQMAKRAKDRLDFLRDLPLLEVPPSKMALEDQERLLLSLQEVTTGYTQTDFFALLGIRSKGDSTPPSRNGKKPGKKASRRDIEAKDMRDAFANFVASYEAGHWQLLDDEELEAMHELFDKGRGPIRALIAKRK